MKDRDFLFHEKWLGLAQPIEGLVFSVPVLADAQIAPEVRAELTASFEDHLDADRLRIRDLPTFLRSFLGYTFPGMLVPRRDLPPELSFYAPEGGQEIRPSWALARGPFAEEDPFAIFDAAPPSVASPSLGSTPAERYFALIWDLTESGVDLDLDQAESVTGPWRYAPTAKFQRLLNHVGIPIGLLFNGRSLRLVYVPADGSPAHLTFRVEHLQQANGRSLLAALDLLLHVRRAYGAAPEHTLGGLLAESRRRQADVTEALAEQVFEAVELLVAGFEAAAVRDGAGEAVSWLRAALEAEDDHFYQGVLSLVLRLVFLLYAEDQSLLPVEHPTYARHLSIGGLYQRLAQDVGAHPESMHHRFGAYGQLLALFRAIFQGVTHGGLELPPRRGKLFDPNSYPFLEGGLPEWTAAVDPLARAAVQPPSLDDGTIYRVLHRLVVFQGQRLSYRTLDVEQIGSVYESLMGYHVLRVQSPAVRLGGHRVWVEVEALQALSPTDRAKHLKESCGLNPEPVQAIENLVKEAADAAALFEGICAHAVGKKADLPRHRADAGRLVLQPGEERRRSGSHYTPRELAEKVVRRTLEPLLACLGPERTAEQILQLKICDPAMGSGAFLVATCRALAKEVVAAWTRRGESARITEAHGSAQLHAQRLVAQRCLYGVDKNAAAVELAKLSLWLVTLSRTLPFTFVDHALRHGDSLVGFDFTQIEAFHWNPPGQVETCRMLLRDALDQAVELRQQILALADHEDPVSQGEKQRLLTFADDAVERVRIVADACVGAFFVEGKDAAREKERLRRLGLVEHWLAGKGEASEQAGRELKALSDEVRDKLRPFHWWIEFPEVFFQERPDPLQGGAKNGVALVDTFIGNPPFADKNNVSQSAGTNYIRWLQAIHAEASGNADLCAHFFRRANSLLGANGTIGLIATKTIAQGDTRTTALQHIVKNGCVIYDATRIMRWPGSAGVSVALVHLSKGVAIEHHGELRLGGEKASHISSRLYDEEEREDAIALRPNTVVRFSGCKHYGEGFIISAEERSRLIAQSPKNESLIFPYIGGSELNSNPTLSFEKFIINFGQLPLEEAKSWPDLLEIARVRVKPGREEAREDTADGAHRKKYWWQFAQPRPDLIAAISSLRRCLVIARDPQHICFAFQPTNRIFNEKISIVASAAASTFAALQSRVHLSWVQRTGRTTGSAATSSYSTSVCFDTFPFPHPDPLSVIPALERIGESLSEARGTFMVDTNQGLTKTYNAIKDPTCEDSRVLRLRRLHEEMDRAVLDAYGWHVVPVAPYCPRSDEERAAVQAFEDEVIDRLYVLNAERAREEERLGLAVKKGKQRSKKTSPPAVGPADALAEGTVPAKTPGRGRAAAKKAPVNQGKLFDE